MVVLLESGDANSLGGGRRHGIQRVSPLKAVKGAWPVRLPGQAFGHIGMTQLTRPLIAV